MRSLATVFQYIKRYPALVGLYFFFNILSAVFALFSLVLLAPFLQVIFKAGVNSVITSRFNFWPISKLYGWLNQQTLTPQGSIKALGVIVVIVVIAVLLKNLFAYLALYVLNPIRNSIINDMRKDMFNKIFRLPIGYFNEQRKGDLMSRLTNDLSVIEYSTISFLEVLFREPITIVILIASMVKLSPELSLFLLVFLPIMGFIIGRVGRSLKKMSTRVQDKLGYILSIIDETISGIRVLKAFNAEELQSKKFAEENRKLLHIKNR
ncbi:MAG: ABC transporter ATP-binding protein, partial [Bacteroidetes bacterium]